MKPSNRRRRVGFTGVRRAAIRFCGYILVAFSFFPQFLPRHGPVFGTTVALASVQLVLDTCYCVGIVLLASRARRWLSRAAIRRRLERVLGATLMALGSTWPPRPAEVIVGTPESGGRRG